MSDSAEHLIIWRHGVEVDSYFAQKLLMKKGIGLNVDLQLLRLEPESGECSFDEYDGILVLPTFVYSVYSVSLVVGGVVMTLNTLAVLAPWLAVIGLVGCIGTIVAKKRQ